MPFTKHINWELQAEEGNVWDVQKDIAQNGVAKIDWLAVIGVRDANGQVSAEQLN